MCVYVCTFFFFFFLDQSTTQNHQFWSNFITLTMLWSIIHLSSLQWGEKFLCQFESYLQRRTVYFGVTHKYREKCPRRHISLVDTVHTYEQLHVSLCSRITEPAGQWRSRIFARWPVETRSAGCRGRWYGKPATWVSGHAGLLSFSPPLKSTGSDAISVLESNVSSYSSAHLCTQTHKMIFHHVLL